MKPIFECTTVQTKPLLRQACARLMRTKLIVHALVLSAAALGFALFVLLRQQSGAYFFAAAFGFACIALAIYRFQSVPNKFAEKTYSDYIKLYREPAKTVVRVYPDQLTVENLQQRSLHRFKRSDHVRLLESGELFLLKRQKSVILLEKAGFTTGTPEEFRSFFRRAAN